MSENSENEELLAANYEIDRLKRDNKLLLDEYTSLKRALSMILWTHDCSFRVTPREIGNFPTIESKITQTSLVDGSMVFSLVSVEKIEKKLP